MNRKKLNTAFWLVFVVLIAGCAQSDEVMPVVNSENCKPEAIKKLKDKTMQQEFSGLCLHSVSNTPESQKISGKW